MWILDLFKQKPVKSDLDLLLDKAMKLGEEADQLRIRRQVVKAQIDAILSQKNDATVEGAHLEAEANNG